VSSWDTIYWQDFHSFKFGLLFIFFLGPGSGLTIYGVFWDTVNFTVTIDEEAAPPPTLYPPLPGDSPLVYNLSFYDVQSLPVSLHLLLMTVVPFSGDTYYNLFFDSAYINTTAPSLPPLSSSQTPTLHSGHNVEYKSP
jgi:hypothetical protein